MACLRGRVHRLSGAECSASRRATPRPSWPCVGSFTPRACDTGLMRLRFLTYGAAPISFSGLPASLSLSTDVFGTDAHCMGREVRRRTAATGAKKSFGINAGMPIPTAGSWTRVGFLSAYGSTRIRLRLRLR